MKFNCDAAAMDDKELEHVTSDEDVVFVLKRERPTTWRILNLMSLLNWSAIPLDIVRVAYGRYYDEPLEGKSRLLFEQRLLSFANLTAPVLRYNFLSKVCDINVAVQRILIDEMRADNTIETHIECLAFILNDYLPHNRCDVKLKLKSYRVMSLMPHIYQLCENTINAACSYQPETWLLLCIANCFALETDDVVRAKAIVDFRLELLESTLQCQTWSKKFNSKYTRSLCLSIYTLCMPFFVTICLYCRFDL